MPKKKYEYERVYFRHDGKQYEAAGKTLKEAHEKAAKKKLALESGDAVLSGSTTVSKWAKLYLETYKEPAVGDAHYKNLSYLVNTAINPVIGARTLKSISEVDLQSLMNTRAGYSKSDLSKLRMLLRDMFKRARKARFIPHNPAEDLTLPAYTEGSNRSITKEERKYILELAKTHHSGLWIKMILYCGPRPCETRALDWRHLDFDRRLIQIKDSMKAGTKKIGAPKTSAGVRKVPIPDELYDDLLAARKGQNDPVFTQPTTGRRHTPSSMHCLWNNFKRELDIMMGAKLYRNKITESVVAEDLVPYCLRHTYCTDLQAAGVSLNVAKYLMGHKDVAVTANIYTHTEDEVIEEAAKKINRRNKKAAKKPKAIVKKQSVNGKNNGKNAKTLGIAGS